MMEKLDLADTEREPNIRAAVKMASDLGMEVEDALVWLNQDDEREYERRADLEAARKNEHDDV